MISTLWFLVVSLVIIINAKLTIREADFDGLTREDVMAKAELISEVQEEGECQYLPRIRRTYQVTVLDDEGQETEEIVDLLDTSWPHRQIIYEADNSETISLTTYPGLNCLEQEDPELIRALREDILHPPSETGIPDRHVPAEERCSEYQQDMFLNEIIFKQLKNGFFIEAGADDFLKTSNSLYFEEKYNWTGLLVEPVPNRFKLGLSANRRSWSAPTCFSTLTRPEYFPFVEAVRPGFMAGISLEERSEGENKPWEFQCFPLYSVLLALDNPTVTLLSLDIEGAEFDVFRSLPWDKVDIEVIVTELVHAGEVFPGSRQEIIQYLESKNYQFVGNLFDDIFVRKDLLGVKYNIDVKDAERQFPLFSSDPSLERQDILDKYFSFWGNRRSPSIGVTPWTQYIWPTKPSLKIQHIWP